MESALDYAELHCNTPQQKLEKMLSIDRSLCFSPLPCHEGTGLDPRLVEAVAEAVSPKAVTAGFKRVPSSELASMSPKSSLEDGTKLKVKLLSSENHSLELHPQHRHQCQAHLMSTRHLADSGELCTLLDLVPAINSHARLCAATVRSRLAWRSSSKSDYGSFDDI